MSQKLANNAFAVLAGSITASASSIPVTSVALLPTLAAGEYFYGTLINSSNQVEHFLCTSISGTNLIVASGGRGVGGSTARGYTAGDRVELRVISLSLLQLALEAPTAIAASGTDTYTAAFSPAPVAYNQYQEYLLHVANTNTSSSPTLNLNSLGAKPIVKPGGLALIAGDIPAEARFRYDGTSMVLLNPVMEVRGTFTPGVTVGGSATGIVVATSVGRYTRIGNRVTFNLYVVLSSKGVGSGIVNVNGLPLTSKNVANANCPVSVYLNAVTGISTAHINSYIGPNSTQIELQYLNAGTSTGIDATNIQNSTGIMASGSYEV